MTTLPFEIPPVDPLTFAGVPVVLAAVAFFTTLLPAWRAASVDPMRALRED
jgi:ABC-type lipoprotein release transport system permease subunit